MEKNNRLLNFIMVVIALVPVIYLAIIWKNIPEIVPLHFNGRLQPDRTGSKSQLRFFVLVIAAISLFLFFLMQNLKHFDPKRRKVPASPVYTKLAAGIVIFITATNLMFVISSVKGAIVFNNFLFPLMGLLFAFMGNYMNNIKPNYFAGFRLPWTLSDDENWRKTHHLAGHLWFWAGIIMAIISLFLRPDVFFPILISMIVIITVVPTVYSYLLFKNKQ